MRRRTWRLRPSTVILIALFVGAAVLYLAIRPNPTPSHPPTSATTTIAR